MKKNRLRNPAVFALLALSAFLLSPAVAQETKPVNFVSSSVCPDGQIAGRYFVKVKIIDPRIRNDKEKKSAALRFLRSLGVTHLESDFEESVPNLYIVRAGSDLIKTADTNISASTQVALEYVQADCFNKIQADPTFTISGTIRIASDKPRYPLTVGVATNSPGVVDRSGNAVTFVRGDNSRERFPFIDQFDPSGSLFAVRKPKKLRYGRSLTNSSGMGDIFILHGVDIGYDIGNGNIDGGLMQSVSWLENDGSAQFASKNAGIYDTLFSPGFGDYDFEVSDTDVDGYSEVVTNENLIRRAEDGNLDVQSFPSTLFRKEFELFDVNGDGSFDIVSIELNLFNGENSIITYFNDGHGQFPTKHVLASRAEHVAIGDLNNDGYVAAIFWGVNLGFDIYSPNGSGQLAPVANIQYPSNVATNYSVRSVALSDINGDGFADIVATAREVSSDKAVVIVLPNNGGTFPADGAAASLVYDLPGGFPGSFPEGSLHVADYDGDHKNDLFVIGYGGKVFLARNDTIGGSIEFSVSEFFQSAGNELVQDVIAFDPYAIVGGFILLFDGAGNVESAWSTDSTGQFDLKQVTPGVHEIKILLRNGAGAFVIEPLSGQFNVTGDIEGLNYTLALSKIAEGVAPTPGSAGNDPLFGSLWGLHNTGQDGGKADVDMNAPEAWNTTRGAGVVVGVIDEQVDFTHPDLKDNIWINTREVAGNSVDDDKNGVVDDIHGIDAENMTANSDVWGRHGSHVAGTIAAKQGNGVGITGVAPEAKIISIDAFNRGSGKASDSAFVRGLSYAIKLKRSGVNLRIINASLGSARACPPQFRDILKAANDAGIVFVAAAGNGGSDGLGDNNDNTPTAPASCDSPNVISVANITNRGGLNDSSNYGLRTVHVAGPGTDIVSAVPGADYEYLTGTSMAAPNVAGVAALLLSKYPQLKPSQVRDILMNSVKRLSDLNGAIASGGVVDAVAALAEGSKSASSKITPKNVKGSVDSKGYITIKWSALSGAKGYRIYRSNKANKKGSCITTVKKNSFKEKFPKSGKQYYYSVSAMIGSKEGPVSSQVSIKKSK